MIDTYKYSHTHTHTHPQIKTHLKMCTHTNLLSNCPIDSNKDCSKQIEKGRKRETDGLEEERRKYAKERPGNSKVRVRTLTTF